MTTPVHLFWDNSNIFVPAKYVAERREGAHAFQGARLQFDNLYRLAHAGRPVAEAVCVGSVPPDQEHLWRRLEEIGVKVELFERGSGSGREQGVDQCLQVHLLRAGYDNAGGSRTAVLLTGDGAGYEDGAGFGADIERLANLGWWIEVLAWRSACNHKLREFAEEVGIFVALDDFYDSITFIQGGRNSSSLSLTRRPLAKPVATRTSS
jgi:hypothetical protein